MNILVSEKPARCELGDVLYGEEYIDSWLSDDFAEEPLNIILLSLCYPHTFAALSLMGFENANEVYRKLEYQCPWTKNKYIWFAPVAIVVKNGDEKKYNKVPKYATTVLKKSAKGVFEMSPERMFENSIINTMMGHGYTYVTCPDDGHGRPEGAIVQLSNGDELIVRCWIWYNK